MWCNAEAKATSAISKLNSLEGPVKFYLHVLYAFAVRHAHALRSGSAKRFNQPYPCYMYLAAKSRRHHRPGGLLGREISPFPFRVTRVLTHRGSSFTANAFEAACQPHKCSLPRYAPPAAQQWHGRALLRSRATGRAANHALQSRHPQDQALRLQCGQ